MWKSRNLTFNDPHSKFQFEAQDEQHRLDRSQVSNIWEYYSFMFWSDQVKELIYFLVRIWRQQCWCHWRNDIDVVNDRQAKEKTTSTRTGLPRERAPCTPTLILMVFFTFQFNFVTYRIHLSSLRTSFTLEICQKAIRLFHHGWSWTQWFHQRGFRTPKYK